MKAVIQRMDFAEVVVDGKTVGDGKNGLLVLLGVADSDTEAEAELMAAKVSNLRIFCDENDKMNLSVLDVKGSVLTVSNFTLCADTKKGNRPSFIGAMEPKGADRLYMHFVECLKQNGVNDAKTGEFGADMTINATLTGPVTILLDTDIWRKK
ncbi:MAG: D-tyrosyl-tRNA(Tyr) deacylase [Ruminococcaceae bacterium]|nr:D-tyrosyl-tRNA(Tyr) deacylase [Oscillospiraceae bacterium]